MFGLHSIKEHDADENRKKNETEKEEEELQI